MKAAASRQQRPTAGPFQIAPTSAPPPRALGAQVVAEEANQGWPRHSTPGWLSVAFPLARAALRSQRQVQRSPLVLGPPKPSRALSLLGTGCGGPHKNSRTSIATAPLRARRSAVSSQFLLAASGCGHSVSRLGPWRPEDAGRLAPPPPPRRSSGGHQRKKSKTGRGRQRTRGRKQRMRSGDTRRQVLLPLL